MITFNSWRANHRLLYAAMAICANWIAARAMLIVAPNGEEAETALEKPD
jgi:hypothetical protein